MCGRELRASSRNLTVMQAILCPLPRLRVSYPQIFVSNSVGASGPMTEGQPTAGFDHRVDGCEHGLVDGERLSAFAVLKLIASSNFVVPAPEEPENVIPRGIQSKAIARRQKSISANFNGWYCQPRHSRRCNTHGTNQLPPCRLPGVSPRGQSDAGRLATESAERS